MFPSIFLKDKGSSFKIIYVCVCTCVCSVTQLCLTLCHSAKLWIVCQASLSMVFFQARNAGVDCHFLQYHMFSSVQFSHSVVSDSLRPHESQHTRPPCPSQTPRVYSNSRPSSRWCHPTISSSATPFSFCLQSFPASGCFPMSWNFSLSNSPSNECSGMISFRIDWFDLPAV